MTVLSGKAVVHLSARFVLDDEIYAVVESPGMGIFVIDTYGVTQGSLKNRLVQNRPEPVIEYGTMYDEEKICKFHSSIDECIADDPSFEVYFQRVRVGVIRHAGKVDKPDEYFIANEDGSFKEKPKGLE